MNLKRRKKQPEETKKTTTAPEEVEIKFTSNDYNRLLKAAKSTPLCCNCHACLIAKAHNDLINQAGKQTGVSEAQIGADIVHTMNAPILYGAKGVTKQNLPYSVKNDKVLVIGKNKIRVGECPICGAYLAMEMDAQDSEWKMLQGSDKAMYFYGKNNGSEMKSSPVSDRDDAAHFAMQEASDAVYELNTVYNELLNAKVPVIDYNQAILQGEEAKANAGSKTLQ